MQGELHQKALKLHSSVPVPDSHHYIKAPMYQEQKAIFHYSLFFVFSKPPWNTDTFCEQRACENFILKNGRN